MKTVIIYSTEYCPYCVHAKQLFDSLKVLYQEIRVDNDDKMKEQMIQRSGRRTVPQIFIGNEHVGGFDDLKALHEKGLLMKWLQD